MAAAVDAAAFDELVTRYSPFVRQFARSIWRGPPGLVDDVVQVAFERLYRSMASGEQVRDVQQYLFTLTRRTLWDLDRRAWREESVPPEWMLDHGDDLVAPDALEDSVLGHLAIDQVMASLPPHSAEVLLPYVGGLTHREIAELLGITEGTVRSRLKRARARVYEHVMRSLDELDPDSSASMAVEPALPLDAYDFIVGLDGVIQRLRQTYSVDAAEKWLVRPHPLLDNQRPIDLLRAGETRRVQGVIDAVAEGVFV